MNNKLSTSELMVALIITIGLFIGSLGIWDGARSADFSPVEPVCYERFQITFRAVLHCEEQNNEQD